MAASRQSPKAGLATGSVASEVSMLFRTKRVVEIRSIESQIRADAEEKSEALRELLGTRYKDLLAAADEMAIIRDECSASVRDSLRDMAHSATALREHFLRKSGHNAVSQAPVTDDLERRKNVHVIGSKLKHIVDSPEVLYARLEEGEVYEAAVRYSLASCNYMELRNTQGVEGVANRFAERRWQQVKVFKKQILAAAERKLITPGLSPVAYSGVLAALIILSGEDRDILTVVDGMLASRTGWINDANQAANGTVTARLRGVATTVRDTISCMAEMLWTEGNANVEQMLRAVDVGAADELLQLRKNGALNSSCVQWVGNIRTWLDEHGRRILVEADTSRILADTLQSIHDVFSDEKWIGACQSTLQESPEFVFKIFAPFISDRAAAVAGESVERAADKSIADIASTWEDLNIRVHAGKVVWSTISSQAVGWKTDTTEPDKTEDEVSELASGEDGDVASIFNRIGDVSDIIGVFESSLRECLRDVKILTQRVPSVADAFNKSVHSSLPRVLAALKNSLESIPVSPKEEVLSEETSGDYVLEKALFVARTSFALGMNRYVAAAYNFRTSCARDAATEAKVPSEATENSGVPDFCTSARALSEDGYRTWATRLCLHLKYQLQKALECRDKLTALTGWAFSDGSPTDLPVSKAAGVLRHPTAASTALMAFLLKACTATNRAGGFALPQEALTFLREEMRAAAAYAYKKAFTTYGSSKVLELDSGQNGGETANADVALMQMLFDVLMLQRLFTGSDAAMPENSKVSLKGVEQQLSDAIDPIDLASCKTAMQESVAIYLRRTSTLLGAITRENPGRSFHTKSHVSITSSQTTSSNLVSLCRTVPRFTYLPAPMPSTYSGTGGGTAGLSAKAALGALRSEATASSTAGFRKREEDTSVAGYASKVSESVGRLGRGFFESWTRKVS